MVGETYERRTRLKVWKVMPGHVCRVVLMRHEPLGHIVHWLGKGSLLCPGERCAACMAGLGARWVGTMPCRLLGAVSSCGIVLVEFSGEAWARTAGLLRGEGVTDNCGAGVELSRRTARSGLCGEPWGDVLEKPGRPMADWVLLDAMATLYHLGRCLEGWTAERWTSEVQEAARVLVEKALLEVERRGV